MAAKKAGAKKAGGKAGEAAQGAQDPLLARVAAHLGVSAEEATRRAVADLARSLGLDERKAPAPEAPGAADEPLGPGGLPRRLYLLLDGRGLDGRGLPIEVIDVPCTVGSGKKNSVWVNSPQIETRHLVITHGDEGWVLEDAGTQHGTFFEGKRVQRKVLRSGDEFALAGYLRLKVEIH